MKPMYLFILSLWLLGSCQSIKHVDPQQAAATKALVAEGPFEMVFSRAHPLTTKEMTQLSATNLLPVESRSGMINMVGMANYVRKYGDSLSVFLPYYGTRQMSGRYNDSNGAIAFEGIPKTYDVMYDDAQQETNVKISFKDLEGEQYQVWATVQANGQVHARVNSSQRTSISYTGEVSKFKQQ
ncbi:MAG: hypothetical protein CL596_07420 [Alteromonas sp.]|nr:hypothetical protein [Alteromonas sp.]MAY21789.1 hypothetical protein [Flavobacteriaceae bacterium]|tara:strand:- start:11617 stop:12165 length:549 start_codon:yes stop_codon:yes gene_type:complete